MASTTPSADKVYAQLQSQVGYHEGANNYNIYADYVGVPNNDAWCTTFLSWGFKKAGYSALCLMSDYSVDQLNWYSARNRLSYYPALGAPVWLGPGGGDHTAFVYAYDADNIYTVEGNWDDQVQLMVRPRRTSGPGGISPYAYGVPAYAEGSITADPAAPVSGSTYKASASLTLAGTTPPPSGGGTVVQCTCSCVNCNDCTGFVADGTTPPVTGADPYAGGLPVINLASPSAIPLQQELKRVGYLASSVAESTNYGSLTQAAVNAYFQQHPEFESSPTDVQIGPAGWAYLRTMATGSANNSTPPATGGTPTAWVSSVAINNKTGVSYARYTAGGTVATWIANACAKRGITSQTAINYWTTGYQTCIARESSGDANACNRNDSNNTTPSGFSMVADYGTGYPGGNLNGALTNYQCSRGCAQCIPQTFANWHCPGTSNMIYDPVANIAASMGYVVTTYGVSTDGHDLASKVQQFDPNRSPAGY